MPSFLEKNVRKKMTLLASGLLPKSGDVFALVFSSRKTKARLLDAESAESLTDHVQVVRTFPSTVLLL